MRDILFRRRDSRISKRTGPTKPPSYEVLCSVWREYMVSARPKEQVPLSKKTVFTTDFCIYMLMECDEEEYYLLLFRNSTHIYKNRVWKNWISNNHTKLWAEDYVHLKVALRRSDGQLLPENVNWRSRYVHVRTQDSMPDVFITFTCNPEWQETMERLK